jgi:hypothetical protein
MSLLHDRVLISQNQIRVTQHRLMETHLLYNDYGEILVPSRNKWLKEFIVAFYNYVLYNNSIVLYY